jgi:rRNA-processing protein FCF1
VFPFVVLFTNSFNLNNMKNFTIFHKKALFISLSIALFFISCVQSELEETIETSATNKTPEMISYEKSFIGVGGVLVNSDSETTQDNLLRMAEQSRVYLMSMQVNCDTLSSSELIKAALDQHLKQIQSLNQQ